MIQEPHRKHLGKAILSTNGQIAFFVRRGAPRLGYPRMIEMEFKPLEQIWNDSLLRATYYASSVILL